MKQFDRLYKTIFESVKPRPSKRNLNRIFKEDINEQNIVYMTPERKEIIEKTVAKLVAENQDYANTIEFADLDTDFFVGLLDECYEDWLDEQGWDEEQPDMFDEAPGFEQFAYEAIKDYLIDYDADREGTSDRIVSNLYDLKKQLFEVELVEALKPQLDTFKAAISEFKEGNRFDTLFEVDFNLRDLKFWDEKGLKYSPELGQKIDKLQRMEEYIYDSGHIFAGDDYGDWDYPAALLEKLGIYNWYMDEDETPELPLESKKVDTSKKVIKEEISNNRREQLYKLALDLFENFNWKKPEYQ